MKAREIHRRHFDRQADQLQGTLQALGAPKYGVFFMQLPPAGERGQLQVLTNLNMDGCAKALGRVLRKHRRVRAHGIYWAMGAGAR